MKSKLKIRIEIDSSCEEPEVVIRTNEKTGEIEDIAAAVEQYLESDYPKVRAFRDDVMYFFSQKDVFRVYTEMRKLIVCTVSGSYEARSTLKEQEEMLDPEMFIRISRFELVNINKITSFDFGVSGTIKVTFEDGSSTWVARRYVRTIQEAINRPVETKEEKQ